MTGGYITKPRGEAHAMWNAGDAPARMIEVISPAGHGLEFADVPWIDDVVERYHLTPPPRRT